MRDANYTGERRAGGTCVGAWAKFPVGEIINRIFGMGGSLRFSKNGHLDPPEMEWLPQRSLQAPAQRVLYQQKSIVELEKEASSQRKKLGVHFEEKINIVGILERGLSKAISGFRFDVIEDDDCRIARGILAFTQFNPPKIGVRRTVYRNVMADDPQARFILVHELAHAVLHRGLMVGRELAYTILATRPDEVLKSHIDRFEDDLETEADRFAAAFLVPIWRINCMSAEQISQSFCVTKELAESRLVQVNAIRAELLGKSSAIVGDQLEPKFSGCHKPNAAAPAAAAAGR
jgi:hypothetical protein